jgi:F-type H+-transporting ATPase subunit epsilon
MFKLDVLTPNGVVLKDFECDDVLVPTSRGQINVLENHTHVLTTLGTGILKARNTKKQALKILSITHGTCKVLGDRISVLSMTSEHSEQIDKKRAEEALKRAEAALQGGARDDEELEKQRRKVQRAKARIEAAYLRGE